MHKNPRRIEARHIGTQEKTHLICQKALLTAEICQSRDSELPFSAFTVLNEIRKPESTYLIVLNYIFKIQRPAKD